MTAFVAFLRGVNLGKRQVKSAELKSAFEAMGLRPAKPLLASGNVIFETTEALSEDSTALRQQIEYTLESRLGFPVGTVLRRQEDLRTLIAADPFAGLAEDAATKLYVTFLAEPKARTLPMPCEAEGDFKVVKLTESEIFIVGCRMPNGRFGLGMERVWKHFGERYLWTSRNWNTVVKAAAAEL